MSRSVEEIQRELDETIQIMRQEVAQYGSDHPRVGQAEARVKQLEDELREERAKR